jgi:hypothetical protein
MARSHLAARGINFRSLSDPIDTTSTGGRLVLHMMGGHRQVEWGPGWREPGWSDICPG